MKLIVNADDFANSLNMSKVIIECAKRGALNSTSIMINSPCLDESLQLLKGVDIRTSLHLNIAEGKPVSDEHELTYLIENGEFGKSFEQVVFDYYLGSKDKKNLIKSDIKKEFTAQILLYSKKLSTKEINLDSHQHYHTIPFIVDILTAIKDELDLEISYIRVPKEPFFVDLSSVENLKNYFGLNIVKHLLLNFFSSIMIKKLNDRKIPHNDSFVGVLFTGNMTLNSIKEAIKKMDSTNIVEILLHPGYLSHHETKERKNDKFTMFYTDIGRKNEMKVLLSAEFKDLIKGLNAKVD